MRVDDECGLACVVRAARRRIDDVTLVSGAAPLRAGLERGVRCPFWDLSRLSFTRPMIFPSFSPGIVSPLVVPCPAHEPTLSKASRRSDDRQGHAAVPCSLRSPRFAEERRAAGSQGYNDRSRISGSAACPGSGRAKRHSPQVSSRGDERRQSGSCPELTSLC